MGLVPIESSIERAEGWHATLRLDGLPDGEWTVRADGSDYSGDDPINLHGEGRGKAGGKVRIVLEPVKPVPK